MLRVVFAIFAMGACSALASAAGPMEYEMSLERWKVLKEAERFQLTAAERLYRDNQHKAAADEYEKFLKLYERSEGASYAQLKYSHCLVIQRKQLTAIKEGYQSLLDYFPDSPEAPIAAYLIGHTYLGTGDTGPAKKAFAKAITAYPNHAAAVWSRLDLAGIAANEKDDATRTNLLRQLTFDVERKGAAVDACTTAARQYTHIMFHGGNFDEGLKALATTCQPTQLPTHLLHGHLGALPQIVHHLVNQPDEASKKNGEKLADASCAWLKTQVGAWLGDPKTKPHALEAWYLAAEVRRHAGQADKQKAIFDEMLAGLGGQDDGVLGHIAQWYKVAGKREEARATYAKYKDATAGKAEIARSYHEERPVQTDKAVAIYRELAADVKTAPTWLSHAAQVYRDGGKPDQAIAVYNELAQLDTAKAGAYQVEIANTLYGAHRWKECVDKYRQCGYSYHNNTHMAAALRQLKQFDEAIGMYRQIVAASPDENTKGSMTFAISQTQEEAGKKEDAIATLKSICLNYPQTGAGSQAHSRLNEHYKIPVTLGGTKK